jgi:hypothetical protein
MTDTALDVQLPTIRKAQIHFSANALVSALAGGPNAYPGIDELPIQALLGFALSNNPWLGARAFGFPQRLHYRTQQSNSFADISGYSTGSEWSPSKQPIVQIEVLSQVDLNNPIGLGTQLDWYAQYLHDSTDSVHAKDQGDHLIIMTPEEKAPLVQELILNWARTASHWRVVTYKEVLESLTTAGVTALKTDQARTLMLTMIRS